MLVAVTFCLKQSDFNITAVFFLLLSAKTSFCLDKVILMMLSGLALKGIAMIAVLFSPVSSFFMHVCVCVCVCV